MHTLLRMASVLAVTASAAAEPASDLGKTSELARAGSVVSLPGLTIHGGDNKYIEATGQVSLTDGILEFIAVEPEGRDYESLFLLNCKPSELKFALLLIGCEPGPPPQEAKPGVKTGDRLVLEVEWQADGKMRRALVEQFLVDRRTGKQPAELPWIFTGSYFTKSPLDGHDAFLADEEQAFISLWWQSAILINVGNDYGNPYRGDNQGFEVNTKIVPPKGATVKLILRKRVQ